MTTTSVHLLLSPGLTDRLGQLNIKPEEYQPAYGGTSVGLDLYNIGSDIRIPPGLTNYTEDWVMSGKADPDTTSIQFKQLFKNLIPTGLRIALPPGWGAFIKERGSIIKTPLKVRAGVIDPGYTGEVFVNCVNLSSHPVSIGPGEKLPFQLVVVQANTNFQLVTENEYQELTSESTRKDGMLGSSDN